MPPRKKGEATGTPKKPAARRPRRAAPQPLSRGLSAKELHEGASAQGAELARAIEADGGAALAVYREPMGGHTLLLAGLPIDKVEPTPYQRDVSDAHVKRLQSAMERLGRYLDPVVAVRRDGRYWTPNGSHRLAASKAMGARSIVALVLPEADVAYQILALNTEKAHNLKERALEVIRMYRGLVGAREGRESDFAPLFEEPSLPTLGAAYEKRPRFSAGAYNPVVRRAERFLDEPLTEALAVREARAERLLALDDEVIRAVDALKRAGLESPYLKNYVVARINPLRFRKGDGSAEYDAVIDQMKAALRQLDPSKVRKEDLARMGGAPAEADAE
jgi:ParB family chromosome partitioning protein